MNSEKNDRNQKRKKLWNRSKTWDKTKAYKNIKIDEKRIWFDVWENFFFFFLIFFPKSLSSFKESFSSFLFPVSVP